MSEKPDFVKSFPRPKNTEIKCIQNKWYLYERFSKYDPVKKRSQKVSGSCLGRITEDGLVPTKRRLVDADSLLKPAEENFWDRISDVVDVGGPLFLWERTTEMRDRLKKYFPDLWEKIYVTTLLRTLKGPRFRRLQVHYETSFLAHMFPKMGFAALNTSEFLQTLGRRRAAISNFMQEDVSRKDVFILFDGHRLITSSKTMELAELGYDSKRRYMPQINLLYVYSMGNDDASPVYYKQYLGSTPDVTAFPDLLKECGIATRDYTIIADKGFASEEDFELLTQQELNYVIPIKRGSRVVAESLPVRTTEYTDVFSYNGRAIQAFNIEQGAFNLFVYYDAQLYANELADAVDRANKRNETLDKKVQAEKARRAKGKGRLSDEEFAKLQPQDLREILSGSLEIGTVTLRTNRIDLNSQQVYRAYKQRQNIEQFFRTYSEGMDYDASYMRSQVSQEAWLFLNHLSALIAMECIADIARLGEDKNISFEDLRQTLGKIMATKIDDQWRIAPVKKSVNTLMTKLDFSLSKVDLTTLLPKDSTT